MVASANGVVAWRRRDAHDDPVLAILGGDRRHPARIADKRLLRLLRCFGDVAVGAGTLREQPELVLSPQQPSDEPAPELFAFRERAGLPRQPRNIVYSFSGELPLQHRIFTTAGIEPLVVTTQRGADELARRARPGASPATVAEDLREPGGLHRAQQRLLAEHGVRYLDCEGGQTLLEALHGARLLDEVFLTRTPFVIDETAHEDVGRIFDFAAAGATLIAEGGTVADESWRFERWRFSQR